MTQATSSAFFLSLLILLSVYGDGIIRVSFDNSRVMRFEAETQSDKDHGIWSVSG